MNVCFNGMQPADACVKTLFEVITDYGNYPGFNPSVTDVTVPGQDGSGAEFPAGWKTKIGKQAHAFHRGEVNRAVFGFGRAYQGLTARRRGSCVLSARVARR
jgi:Polyketide cyclase / dehydrase and lipid transport